MSGHSTPYCPSVNERFFVTYRATYYGINKILPKYVQVNTVSALNLHKPWIFLSTVKKKKKNTPVSHLQRVYTNTKDKNFNTFPITEKSMTTCLLWTDLLMKSKGTEPIDENSKLHALYCSSMQFKLDRHGRVLPKELFFFFF